MLGSKLLFAGSLLAAFLPGLVFATSLPSPTSFVNDFAGVLTADQKATLEASLQEYEKQTQNEIAVVFVKNLDGEDIEGFTVRLFEEWKIGKKGQDNGILFLASIEDRAMRIEVGYGLEPLLTDGSAGVIIRDFIAPEFKKGDYYAGVTAGIAEIQKNLGGTPSDETGNGGTDLAPSLPFDIFVLFYALLSLLLSLGTYVVSYLARSKSFWMGGVAGGILGLLGSLFLFQSLSTGIRFLPTFLLGGLGLLLDWYLSKTYQVLKAQGKETKWWATRGGFFTGGGGRHGGGGFGGFGGGGSGGGGASGRW